jgi:hypothetical protein
MPKYNPKATAYIAALPSPQQEICRALRKLILENFPDITEEFKWNFPAYYYQGKRICITGGFKHHANIELFYGAKLKDREGRVEGNGKRTRHIKLTALEDIDEAYFVDLIRQSIALAEGTLEKA